MKRFFIFTFASLCAVCSHMDAQESTANKDTCYWKYSGIGGINLSQSALVNWSKGGENSASTNFYFNGSMAYTKKHWAWDNDFVFDYGLTFSEQNKWRKNIDKISFASKLGYSINKKWYYSMLIDFNSQLAKGYNYPNKDHYTSKLMAPAYSNLAFGIDYKPNDAYSFFMSPTTVRTTFVLDDSLSNIGAFGVDKTKKTKIQVGAYFKASAKKNLMENVDMISKLDLFTPYDKDFGNVDINWDLLLSFKINKLLTTTLNTTLRYYDKEHFINSEGENKGPKIQFKEILGMGFAYKF